MTDFLTGKTINAIKIADDKKAILFVCADGEHIARADGDCCSNTWVESISAPALGFPCVVIGTENLDMPDRQNNSDHEVIAYYGLKITTDKGEIIIDYRNESDGDYGGGLAWPGEYFYGGVFGQNDSALTWREVEFA